MPPRPLHRWKSFWFGLLVVAFLGGAWFRSTRTAAGFDAQTSSRRWILGQTSGEISFYTRSTSGTPGIQWVRQPVPHSRALRPWPPVRIDHRAPALRIFITHWFLIVLFLVPWAGFLIWRVRRVKRLAAG